MVRQMEMHLGLLLGRIEPLEIFAATSTGRRGRNLFEEQVAADHMSPNAGRAKGGGGKFRHRDSNPGRSGESRVS